MSRDLQKRLIGVAGDPEGKSHEFLFRALSQLFPVEFRPMETAAEFAPDALLVLNGDLAAGVEAAAAGLPALVVMEGRNAPGQIPDQLLRFGMSARLDPCLHNQTMINCESVGSPLAEKPGDEVLASLENQPVWLVRPTAAASCQLVAIALPKLQESDMLFPHLSGRRFMGLLPLMHFLREQVKDVDWTGSPSRACFVFDDPNFHRRSYGFLNFRQLADHAQTHNYFAAVATIPLDAWWVNAEVAELLRSSSPRLSVLIHGNNHTTYEMLSPGSTAERRSRFAQAIFRMERLGRRHRIPIVRVMEAPYGAIAEGLFHDLLVLGYEAALCTPELLVQHNPLFVWPTAFGLDRSDTMGGGLPVIPRIRLSTDWKNDVLLAAFLRQPIIVSGHHFDAAHGLQSLADLARMVNGLDGVIWSDIPGILRANYRQRIEGDVLTVKLHSRCVVVTIPPGIRSLRVHRSWIREGQTEKLTLSTGLNGGTTLTTGALSSEVAVGGAGEIRVLSEIENPLHLPAVRMPRPNPWAMARKILMETRDRLSPAVPLMGRLRRPNHRKRP